jgi:APA family basic amino acid/polyamine antiporter
VARPDPPALRRLLGTSDAVTIGLGSMLGAGIFVVLAPASAAAGSGLLLGLAVAAVVAYCNATSSARLAALHPVSGGTYVYGRERLGPFWGYLAGVSFIVGKTASCAAVALTVGVYVWPSHANAVAVASVVALTVVNTVGVQKSAWLTRAIVVVVLAVLTGAVVAVLGADVSRLVPRNVNALGVLQAAGLCFFAFAGYARIATLGEEVRDPARTIPRAIRIALGVALVVYAVVAVAVLAELGSTALASSTAPLTDAVMAAGHPGLAPAIRVGAAVAALGSLLALILGVSRTVLAMARDGHLPGALTAVNHRFASPYRAEIAVGIVVSVLAASADLRGAIGFSSFAVLVYYAIANASALTLGAKMIPVAGLVGCLVLAFTLPVTSVAVGVAVLLLGALAYAANRRARRVRFLRG